MKEEININLNTINDYYLNNGFDNKLNISIISLINKFIDYYNDKVLLIIKFIFLIQLLLDKKIELKNIYKIIKNKDNLRKYLINNIKYFKEFNDYNKLIMIVDNKKEFNNIYKEMLESNFITNINNIIKDNYERNTFFNKKILELDEEIKVLIDKYNRNKQIKSNIYLDINNNKIHIKVKPFWKVIDRYILSKYSSNVILGFSNTYCNDFGVFLIEDLGVTTIDKYSIWIKNLLGAYLDKENLNIINYDISDNLSLLYKIKNKKYYVYIYTIFNKYNNHLYKFIKTSNSENDTNIRYEINSFKVLEEMNYKIEENIYSKLFGNIKYDYNEKKYIFEFNDIIYKLDVNINNEIDYILNKCENIYKSLNKILYGIYSILKISDSNVVYTIEVGINDYIIYLKNNNNYKDTIIKIDNNGNIIYNNLKV